MVCHWTVTAVACWGAMVMVKVALGVAPSVSATGSASAMEMTTPSSSSMVPTAVASTSRTPGSPTSSTRKVSSISGMLSMMEFTVMVLDTSPGAKMTLSKCSIPW